MRLAVAIFKTTSPDRQPDPVVFLQGGPGAPIVQNLAPVVDRSSVSVLLGDHDLILIDQRGTGLSRPALDCPEVHPAVVAAVRKSSSVGGQVNAERVALQRCHDRLTHKGIDLDTYTIQNDAADIADLRIALRLPQMDLYAVSYGTRVALDIMRSYPAGLRSVVLDSVVPPQFNIFVDPNAAEAHAFHAFFDGCKRAKPCRHAHPHLERTFDRLLTRLNQKPSTVKIHQHSRSYTVPINGDEVAQYVRGTMYSKLGLSLVPGYIEQLNVGQRAALLDLYDTLTQPPDVSEGMYRSVICSEDAPYATSAALHASVVDLPEPLRAGALTYQTEERAICRIWNIRASDPSLRQPVRSAIPTLLLGGEYDPITPPSNVDLVAPTLSRSYSFVFPGSGHGVRYTDECPDYMINSFYDDPLRRPDSSCIAAMKEPFS
jgi:pimeloyl-ACP methyl ester carboxylesterase